MAIKVKEIYKIIPDFRELQENNFYNLPLNIILVLQNNFSIINNLYTIIKQTEQVILERNNYQNYDKEIEDLMETSFSINPLFFEYSDKGLSHLVTFSETKVIFHHINQIPISNNGFHDNHRHKIQLCHHTK